MGEHKQPDMLVGLQPFWSSHLHPFQLNGFLYIAAEFVIQHHPISSSLDRSYLWNVAV